MKNPGAKHEIDKYVQGMRTTGEDIRQEKETQKYTEKVQRELSIVYCSATKENEWPFRHNSGLTPAYPPQSTRSIRNSSGSRSQSYCSSSFLCPLRGIGFNVLRLVSGEVDRDRVVEMDGNRCYLDGHESLGEVVFGQVFIALDIRGVYTIETGRQCGDKALGLHLASANIFGRSRRPKDVIAHVDGAS